MAEETEDETVVPKLAAEAGAVAVLALDPNISMAG
jgi:hypothetical protein